ncbi:MAG: endo alpha-1,4 polygalactosaminidase [Anaerolineales bacterium]|nr:endo alpha-1,4 polygalactosaminidase [Anaerolineales bacterium]
MSPRHQATLLAVVAAWFLLGCARGGAPVSARSRIKSVDDYIVYYGQGQADALSRFDLAIVQPETLSEAEIRQLRRRGTLVVAYLSIGEAEPGRPWYTDGRVDPRWLLGLNKNWGSYFVDANQPGWQRLMVSLTGDFIQKGFDGVFLDTVDTVDAYPQTRQGMIATIKGLRQAFPEALILQNRGFGLVPELASDLDGVMFEDVSTTYDFDKEEYVNTDNSDEITTMIELHEQTGLPVLALDYAPPDNPGMAFRAVEIARSHGFIPAVSTINLDEIPAYGLGRQGPADMRVAGIRAEGDETSVTLVVRIQNTGLAMAEDVPLVVLVGGRRVAELRKTFSPGVTYDWNVPWDAPQENVAIEAVADSDDPTPANNRLDWLFTFAAIALEPILPFDQQQHRPSNNGPELHASRMLTPPMIDGDLAEWADFPCIVVDRQDQVSFGESSQWGGPSDLSARVCYGWDPETVYIGFRVRDDAIVQENTGGNLWRGDHVELWFDTQLQLDFDSMQAGEDDYQIGISPGDFAAVPPGFFIFTPPTLSEDYSGVVQYAVVKTRDGYAGEARIPWAVLKGLRLAPGHTIGATFEPSDTDTAGSDEQEMMMSTAPRSSGEWGNPTLWNNLLMQE